MELRQLQMLLAVVHSGGYLKAGQSMNISHSAIHRQIRLLEEEIRDRVLVRAGKRVELTSSGKILADLASRVFLEKNNSLRQISEMNRLDSGILRIGTGTTMICFFLPDVLKIFHKEFPKVDVRLVTGTSDYVKAEIDNGKLDLGVVLEPAQILDGTDTYQCDVLYREEFVWAVGKGHSMARRKIASLADLAQIPLILYTRGSILRKISQLFEKKGVALRIGMQLENEEAIEKMIEINMGLGLLSRRRATSDRVHYFRLRDQPIYFDVGLVWRKTNYLPRAVKEFVRVCHEVSSSLRKDLALPPSKRGFANP
jgi:DNA-binding transcriptional LysR family regulator